MGPARAAVQRAARALGIAPAVLSAACASGPPPAPAPPVWSEAQTARADALEAYLEGLPASEGEALVVRLAFEPDVDLDLYVTDPRLETVYFGNTPLRTGGALEADARCADGGVDPRTPRVETVRFDAPQPGAYRVGVDHPERCAGDGKAAPFAVSIEHRGERRTLRGLAPLLVFTPIVAEHALP